MTTKSMILAVALAATAVPATADPVVPHRAYFDRICSDASAIRGFEVSTRNLVEGEPEQVGTETRWRVDGLVWSMARADQIAKGNPVADASTALILYCANVRRGVHGSTTVLVDQKGRQVVRMTPEQIWRAMGKPAR